MLKRVQHDWMQRFRNIERYHSRHYFLEVPLIVIPNLLRDHGVDLIQKRVHDLGREGKDGSSHRPAGPWLWGYSGSWEHKMLKRVQHDWMRRFRNNERYHSRHYFLEVPLIVIPNLFRDHGVDLIQKRVHDLGREGKDGSSHRPAGSCSLAQSGS